jgi:hypothetical protein
MDSLVILDLKDHKDLQVLQVNQGLKDQLDLKDPKARKAL